MNKQFMTINAFYAIGGGIIIFLTYVMWKSFLLEWQPIEINFNFYGEGFFELMIVSWAAIWLIVYIGWRIRKYYEVGQ